MTRAGRRSRSSNFVSDLSAAPELTVSVLAVLSLGTAACSSPSATEGVERVVSLPGPVALHTLPSEGDGADDLLIGGSSGLYLARGGVEGLGPAERVDRSPVATRPGSIVWIDGENGRGILVHAGRHVRWYPASGDSLDRPGRLRTPWTRTLDLERADLDGDRRSEAVALGTTGDTVFVAEIHPVSRRRADVLWSAVGTGRLVRSQLSSAGREPGAGCDSLLVARYGAGGGRLGRLDCDVGGGAALERLVSGVAPADLVTGDFDGDGSTDVGWADLEGGLQWWHGGDTETLDPDFRAFDAAQILRAEGISRAGYARAVASLPPTGELVDEAALAALDHDGDGDTDLVAVSPGKGVLRLYPNLDGGFGSGASVASGFDDADDVAVGQFDGVPGSDVAVAADGFVWLVSEARLEGL